MGNELIDEYRKAKEDFHKEFQNETVEGFNAFMILRLSRAIERAGWGPEKQPETYQPAEMQDKPNFLSGFSEYEEAPPEMKDE